MAQLKKNVARLVIKGIGLLGILQGVAFVCVSIALTPSLWKDGFDLPSFWFIILEVLVAMVVLGVFLTYTSYQMLRGRAFGAAKLISALLALDFFGLAEVASKSLTAPPVSEGTARWTNIVVHFAFFVGMFVVYAICMKLFNRLLAAAYGPPQGQPQPPGQEGHSR